ncbi:Hypothetical predicted protein [Podarcis lilfordi]|uniref:Uncharacterized protein n=1 Tax=Podarcis lilfordi TaxID=74358 RepID=A0AA35KN95_9SAUR|nr:Hypothetical predicted protein [Podarcis lilfordi]
MSVATPESGATGPNDPPHISSWKRIVLLVPQTNQATAAVQVEPLKKKEIPSTCTAYKGPYSCYLT